MVLLDMDMPSNCGSCPMCMIIQGALSYCMAGRFRVKLSELDLRDGICPLQELDNLKSAKFAKGKYISEIDKLQTYKMYAGEKEVYVCKEDVKDILRGECDE